MISRTMTRSSPLILFLYRIGVDLCKILKICAVSSFPAFLTRAYARKESTSSTYILLEESHMSHGRSSRPEVQNTKHTKKKERRYCGRQSNDAFRISRSALNFPSLDRPSLTRHFYDETVERMVWHGRLEHQHLMPAC